MRRSSFVIVVSFYCVCLSIYPHSPMETKSKMGEAIMVQDSLKWADYYYNIHRYKKAIPLYEKNLYNPNVDKKRILKRLALSEAALEKPVQSTSSLNQYLQIEFNPNFLLNEGFDPIRESKEFKKISETVIPKVTTWSIIYLFVSIIGFYVVFLIGSNQQIHLVSRILIGLFVFIHSFFIMHISINSANYFFQYPHTYLMSTWGIFLYGPLLYFYLKKTSHRYNFKIVDLLHLLPTVVISVYLIKEVYVMSGHDKIILMLERIQRGQGPQDSDRLALLVVLKALSLTIYGYFIGRTYIASKRKNLVDSKVLRWQKNLYHIHILYVCTYTAYGLIIINGQAQGWLFHTSAATMALMVLFIGYSANIQPDVFNGVYAFKNGRLFPKYQKSGLTPSLSMELKENLLHLFAVEKIYRENNISLDMVAQRLNTTRHNASQIINEHFEVSFHELVNMYRIKEAKELLLDYESNKLNIINIAYEVGYNNKVTFNKAFKKDTNLTPTEYQKAVLNT